MPLIPAHKWNNSIKINFKSTRYLKDCFTVLNMAFTLPQSNPGQFETQSADNTLINLGIGCKVTVMKMAFDVNLNGNNLLNKTYISHLSRLKPDGIPNMGRNIVVGVTFNM